METRGVRNNNPGNIDYRQSDPWQGLADPPIEQGVPKPRFARFVSPAYGIRALARTLITYQDKHGIDTIRGIINRWAPPVENDTGAYVRAVASHVGVDPDQHIDVHQFGTMHPLVEAIIHHENAGYSYPDTVMREALHMAGIEPPARPIAKSKTIQGAAATGGAGLLAIAPELAEVARESAWDADGILKIVLTLIILIGTGVAIYSRLKRRRETGV